MSLKRFTARLITTWWHTTPSPTPTPYSRAKKPYWSGAQFDGRLSECRFGWGHLEPNKCSHKLDKRDSSSPGHCSGQHNQPRHSHILRGPSHLRGRTHSSIDIWQRYVSDASASWVAEKRKSGGSECAECLITLCPSVGRNCVAICFTHTSWLTNKPNTAAQNNS